jgi:PTH1 family peptidyl-tRNA hydrolase
MLLFAGLGNPGPRHSGNRHNIGFLAVDAIHRRHRFSPWRRRFQGEAAEGEIAGAKILLLKPETFMNESGNAGHNGLRSITALCGNDYQRVRLGIGHPGDKNLVYPYVLSDFFKDELPWVEVVLDSVANAAEFLASGRSEEFQNRVHLAIQTSGKAPVTATPDQETE